MPSNVKCWIHIMVPYTPMFVTVCWTLIRIRLHSGHRLHCHHRLGTQPGCIWAETAAPRWSNYTHVGIEREGPTCTTRPWGCGSDLHSWAVVLVQNIGMGLMWHGASCDDGVSGTCMHTVIALLVGDLSTGNCTYLSLLATQMAATWSLVEVADWIGSLGFPQYKVNC